jgi:RNA polymerase sigma factor (sigma-70 family)
MSQVAEQQVTVSTATLVEAAAAGDSAAWDEFVERFSGTVWAVARSHRLSGFDAADVSQTTWLRLIENLDRIRDPERVGAWLATTARRESLRIIRMSGRQIPTGDDLDLVAADEESGDLERHLLAEDRDRVLAELVDLLPCRCQLILRLLSADAPLSYRDLSESLDMPIGSIGPTRARCLAHLRRMAVRAGLSPERD